MTGSSSESTVVTERVLPISAGRFGMWVFISTEIMLFAGIFASYLVIRLSAIGFSWPMPTTMHMSLTTGVFNTMVLVLSSVTAASAVKAADTSRPASAKLWLLATMALGTFFLVVKGTEYYEKYRIGLIPSAHQKQVFHDADYHYLSAVDGRLKEEINRVELQKDRLSASANSDEIQERLDYLYDLRTYITGWTVRMVGRLDNSYQEQVAIRLLANLIFHHADTSRGIKSFAENEADALERSYRAVMSRQGLAKDRQDLVSRQITEIEQQIDEIKILNPQLTGSDAQQIEEKTKWLDVKRKQMEMLETEIDDMAARAEQTTGRLNWLLALSEMEHGLNYESGLKLPVVITNGHQWISLYLLITGIHALHVFAGLLVFLWFVPRRLNTAMGRKLAIVGIYWLFVDFVWLGIFGMFYF